MKISYIIILNMKSLSKSNNTIKINNGYLKLTEVKNTQTLTFKYLLRFGY